MKHLIVILLLTISANLFAQQDTVSVKSDSIHQGYVSKVRNKLSAGKERLTFDRLLKKETLKSARQKTDSLKAAPSSVLDSVRSIQVTDAVNHKSDSLQGMEGKPVEKVNENLAGLEGKIQRVPDSLQSVVNRVENKLVLPDKVQNKTDSLQNKVKSFDEKLSDAEHKVQSKADSLQNKITRPVTKVQDKVIKKVSALTDGEIVLKGKDKSALPGADIPGLNTKGKDLPGGALSAVDGKLPDVNAVNLTKDLELPNIGDLDLKAPDVKDGLSDVKLPDVKGLDKIKDVSGQVNKLDGTLAEAEKYEGDLQNLKKGEKLEKLPGEAEAKVKNIEQVKVLDTQMNKAQQMKAEQEALIQKYRDEQLLQAEIKRKSALVANEHFAKETAAVKKAQANLSKSKKGLSSIKSAKDVFKRKSGELEGKKFHQRLVPGLTLQIHNDQVFTMDMGVQAGYRFSPRFTTGVGFTYRVGVNDKYKYLVANEGVYATRIYSDLATVKQIFVHAEFEYIKLDMKKFSQPAGKEVNNPNVYASYFGLGRKFNISRKVKGSVIGLYRVEYDGTLPSMRKVNVRLGFDYVMGKRRRVR